MKVVWAVYYDCSAPKAPLVAVPGGWPPPGGVKELVTQLPIMLGLDAWADAVAAWMRGSQPALANGKGWVYFALPTGQPPPLTCSEALSLQP